LVYVIRTPAPFIPVTQGRCQRRDVPQLPAALPLSGARLFRQRDPSAHRFLIAFNETAQCGLGELRARLATASLKSLMGALMRVSPLGIFAATAERGTAIAVAKERRCPQASESSLLGAWKLMQYSPSTVAFAIQRGKAHRGSTPIL
jgi:hypothetical protein